MDLTELEKLAEGNRYDFHLRDGTTIRGVVKEKNVQRLAESEGAAPATDQVGKIWVETAEGARYLTPDEIESFEQVF